MTEAGTIGAQEFNALDYLDRARRAHHDEEAWVAAHKGAVAASELSYCIRPAWFRAHDVPGVEVEPTREQLRRWAWGLVYEDMLHEGFKAAGRRTRRQVEVELGVNGMTIVGHADFLWPEAIGEAKTTQQEVMNEDLVPFGAQLQLGAYQAGLNRAGQLLFGSFRNEWSFDFPSLPPMFTPYVTALSETWRYATTVAQIPPYRMYCENCAYKGVCPREEPEETRNELTDLEAQIVMRYLRSIEVSRPAEKEAESAKKAIDGLRETMGMTEQRRLELKVPGFVVAALEISPKDRTDWKATYEGLPEEVQKAHPAVTKPSTSYLKWTVKEAE